jgi:hypothetical protein
MTSERRKEVVLSVQQDLEALTFRRQDLNANCIL